MTPATEPNANERNTPMIPTDLRSTTDRGEPDRDRRAIDEEGDPR
ncbi:hypothetical protein ACFQE8_23550 [Salinirubellus sp. GCM10025818]|jgi:hypothetical protein